MMQQSHSQRRNPEPITSFSGKYEFLSNFHRSTIVYQNEVYKSVEHAYQAAKADDAAEREHIINAPTPRVARDLGQSCALRPEWDDIKLDIMRELVEIKFQDVRFLKPLMATGKAILIEGNSHGDRFFGCEKDSNNKWVGHNHLGLILMKIREKANARR